MDKTVHLWERKTHCDWHSENSNNYDSFDKFLESKVLDKKTCYGVLLWEYYDHDTWNNKFEDEEEFMLPEKNDMLVVAINTSTGLNDMLTAYIHVKREDEDRIKKWLQENKIQKD